MLVSLSDEFIRPAEDIHSSLSNVLDGNKLIPRRLLLLLLLTLSATIVHGDKPNQQQCHSIQHSHGHVDIHSKPQNSETVTFKSFKF
jgi:hypothetical protein